MAEEQSEALGGLEAERYQIELVPLATGIEAPRSWRYNKRLTRALGKAGG